MVQTKGAPEGCGLNSQLVWIPFITEPMQAEFNGHPHTLSSIVPTLRVSTAACLADRHYTQSLYGSQGVVVALTVKKSQRFFEKVITRGVGVVWVGSSIWLSGESAAKSKQGIDQDWRAVSVSAIEKVLQKMLLAQRGKRRVLPAEVQCKQVLH
jgi:hypothetical protein